MADIFGMDPFLVYGIIVVLIAAAVYYWYTNYYVATSVPVVTTDTAEASGDSSGGVPTEVVTLPGSIGKPDPKAPWISALTAKMPSLGPEETLPSTKLTGILTWGNSKWTSSSPTIPTSARTQGYPRGYANLNERQQHLTMSGAGYRGYPVLWPRQAITSVDGPHNADYQAIPKSGQFIGNAPTILGCPALCRSTGKCKAGAYYYQDLSTPNHPTGKCFAIV